MQQVFKIEGIEYDASQFGTGEAKTLSSPQLQAHLAKTFAGTAAEKAFPLFHRQFVLLDNHGKPMPGIDYTAELVSGERRHGTTDQTGTTASYATESKEEIKIYAGHNTKEMTERYLIGSGHTSQEETRPMRLQCKKYAPAQMNLSSQDFPLLQRLPPTECPGKFNNY